MLRHLLAEPGERIAQVSGCPRTRCGALAFLPRPRRTVACRDHLGEQGASTVTSNSSWHPAPRRTPIRALS